MLRDFLVALTIALAIVGCQTSGKGKAEGPKTPVAEINGRKITQADYEAYLARMPRLARAEFSGDAGRNRVIEHMVEKEMLLLAAKADGIDRDEVVRAQLEESERETIVQAYLDKKREEAGKITEDEVRAYYESHKEEFTTEEALRVRLLAIPDRKRLEGIRNLVVQGALSFEDACRKHSDNPEIAAAGGLVPEWVRRGRAVPWIGNHPVFHEVAFAAKVGEISPVFETPKGFLFIRVEEHSPGKVRTFEEVRAGIEGRLKQEKVDQALPSLMEDLKKKYKVKVFEGDGTSAEQIFSKAQVESSPEGRIKLYREILERYPNDEHVVEALFMIGFIQSEELGNSEVARETFQEVVQKYPKHELAESARWMLSEESKTPPPFEADSAAAGNGP